MPIELKMPALSPTMEEGTLAKWLVKEGDEVKSGDILAEIETDKATMEFEAVDEGKIAKILVPEGTDGVKVGAPIAIMAGEGEDASTPPRRAQGGDAGAGEAAEGERPRPRPTRLRRRRAAASSRRNAAPRRAQPAAPSPRAGGRPHQGLAARAPPRRRRRTSTSSALQGSGPGGRIVRADIDAAVGKAPAAAPAATAAAPAAARLTLVLPGADRAGDPARGGQALATCARRSRAA